MSQLTRKDFKQQINKGQFYNFYLIYGDEKMYVKVDTDSLVTKLMGKTPNEFNYHTFVYPCSLDDVAVAVQVVPFASEYNCVKIADMDVNSFNDSEMEQLISILKNVPDTTVVIFTMPTLEHNAKSPGAKFSKLVKFVEKNGVVCFDGKESDINLARQLVKWASKMDVKMEQADAYKLIEYAGEDLNTLRNELDKLCSYVGEGGLITREHIELLVPKRLEANIFYLAEDIIAERSDNAFTALDALFYQKVEPDQIIIVLSRAYIDFYRARVALESGISTADIAKEFNYGRRAFLLNKGQKQTKKMPTSALRDSLDVITETIAEFHSVGINKRLALDNLIAKLLILAGER